MNNENENHESHCCSSRIDRGEYGECICLGCGQECDLKQNNEN